MVDPAVGAFLDLLDHETARHPERVRPVTQEFAQRLYRLTAGMTVDLEMPIEGPVLFNHRSN